jgi:hypothetical protein
MSEFAGFNNRYQAELVEQIQVMDQTILRGNVGDFAEYKRLVGRRDGLMYALERHKELITLMEQASDK